MNHPSLHLARAMLAFAGLLAVLAPVAANPAPLSLHAAMQAALARSRSLDAATAAAQAARDMAVAATRRPDPVLRLSLEELPVNGAERFRPATAMRSMALMQTLPSADKRRARGERFEREVEAALSERAQRAAALQVEVAQAWLERHRQERLQQILHAQIEEARLLVQALDGAVRGGTAATANVLMARETLAQLEQGLIAAESDLANARLTLARFTGLPPAQPLAELPAYERTPNHAGTADVLSAPDDLPELLALRAREAVARAEAGLAQQEFKPDWSVELMLTQRSAGSANTVSIGVSVPLQWNRPRLQQRELSAKLARVAELEAEREEITRERWLQVQRWQQDWRAGLKRLAHLDAQRQPLGAQRIAVALAAYAGGREPLGTVLQARRDALSLALERLALERETAGLWARLAYLTPIATPGAQP